MELSPNWEWVTILVFLAALVQPKNDRYQKNREKHVTILVFLAALVQLERTGLNWNEK